MAVRILTGKSLHTARPPVMRQHVPGARPKTISEAYAFAVRADRPPQSKAGQG